MLRKAKGPWSDVYCSVAASCNEREVDSSLVVAVSFLSWKEG